MLFLFWLINTQKNVLLIRRWTFAVYLSKIRFENTTHTALYTNNFSCPVQRLFCQSHKEIYPYFLIYFLFISQFVLKKFRFSLFWLDLAGVFSFLSPYFTFLIASLRFVNCNKSSFFFLILLKLFPCLLNFKSCKDTELSANYFRILIWIHANKSLTLIFKC